MEWLTLLFVTIYAVILYLRYLYQGRTIRNILLIVGIFFMVCETLINTGVTSVANVSRSGYLQNLAQYAELYNSQFQE